MRIATGLHFLTLCVLATLGRDALAAASAPAPAPPAPPGGVVDTNPASVPTKLVPAPPSQAPAPRPAPKPVFGLTTLRILADKGLISPQEYEAAKKDLNDLAAARAESSPTITFAGWKTTLYGYVQADMMYHSTQSFPDFSSNFPVARPDTYAGQHGRFQATIRDTRIGLRIQAPPLPNLRVSGVIETDFLGPTGTVGSTISENGFYVNANLRIRHAFLKMETPIVDVMFGHYWDLFGWQPHYFPAIVQWPGLVGELFSRTIQLRLSHTFKTEPVNVEIAAAAVRPPARDSAVPEGQAGVRLVFNKWTGWHTGYLTSTALTAASIGLSGDLRYFRVPEFAEKPLGSRTATGMGFAASAYLPIVPAKKDKKDNSLSLVGEFVTGRSINDMYTGLNGGVSHAALPNPTGATPAPVYTSTVDAGLAVYDANGELRLPRWTTFLVGVEYYPPFMGGRVALFANVSRSQLHDAGSYPNPAKVRDHESFYEVGFFVDPSPAVRFGLDYAHIDDVYADGVKASNEAAQLTGFLFF
ncbi:hypothetical protein [Polyangium jinanense]|uniref:SHOCT domain-containing protein n=1 Tax=Polyangium jinanense TaxID=2829994 RepID=A0A9X3X3N9_9BACT|nr:hypothetical protein [Polyangium jinanense]MDC3982180.1 SHOCT domain-containing protein [Polyangium jinanense]